jgi:inositol-hexakisphosphate 5-kinase
MSPAVGSPPPPPGILSPAVVAAANAAAAAAAGVGGGAVGKPRPYPHQVGGHGQLVQMSPGTVLKPLIPKEAAFYDFIYSDACPESLTWLRAVTPRYYGTLVMRAPQASSAAGTGNTALGGGLVAAPRLPGQTTDPVADGAAAAAGAAFADGAGGPINKNIKMAADEESLSPWAQCMAHRCSADSYAVFPSSAVANTVVVLEDVNYGYRFPCVMDVKIGLRHYDDDATTEKRMRHIEKAESTTTSTTGVRFIGLQSYKGTGFDFRDKYHGRNLKEADLVPESRWFFSNDTRLRTDCLALTLAKLRAIADKMELQKHFQFYSSSLLLVYEGDVNAPARVDVRLIDFAHTQRSNGVRDTGYLFGIRYLISVFEAVQAEEDRLSPEQLSPSVSNPVTGTGDKILLSSLAQNGRQLPELTAPVTAVAVPEALMSSAHSPR